MGEVKRKKIRKVFLDDLPKWKGGKNKGSINWIRSVGYKVRFIYDDIEGEVEIVGYEKDFIYIKYKNKDIFKIFTGHFKGCRLGRLLDKYTNEFKIEIGTRFKDDKRDLIIIDRKHSLATQSNDKKQNYKYYKYRCNKCGFECEEHYRNGEYKEEFWIEESNLSKNGCSCCSKTNKGIIVQGINDIPTTASFMIPYFQGGYDEAKRYSPQSNQKIIPICPDCGRIKDKKIGINNIYNNKGVSCSCGDGFSYGHKYVYNLLTQLDISFVDNKKIDWCEFYNPFKQREVAGEYDFVIKGINLIIEVDGSFHKKDNKMSGQKKEESEYLDGMKNKLADKNGYKVIRINYDDDLNMKDNILNSELSKSFDLSKINWNICEEFALSNRVKEACELKRDNPYMTTIEIGKIMSLDISTIRVYLKKGSKLGWCDYDPKEEKRKGRIKSGKMSGKQLEIFKDDVSLGIFESLTELERQSEELFGVKLNRDKISMVCRNKQKQYKGFTFKYTENQITN